MTLNIQETKTFSEEEAEREARRIAALVNYPHLKAGASSFTGDRRLLTGMTDEDILGAVVAHD